MTKPDVNYEREGLHLRPHFKIRCAADDLAGHQEKHDAVRRYRQRIAPWLVDGGDRLPMHERPWFRISEIADVCAQIPDSVQLDEGKRERAIELLRKAILTGEFEDTNGRSRVANLHPAFAAELRFARGSAAEPSYFRPWISYLWIKRADCEAWFRHNRMGFPKNWVAAAAVAHTQAGSVTSRKGNAFQTERLRTALDELYQKGLPPIEILPDNAIVRKLQLFFIKEKWDRRPSRRTIIRLLKKLRPETPKS